MRILILEDDGYRVRYFLERFCEQELKVTENASSAIRYLNEYIFDYIFLDNDLGPGNGEGIEVAEFLYSNPDNMNNSAEIIIHSWNRPAAEIIKSKLPRAIHAPFKTNNFFNLNLDI